MTVTIGEVTTFPHPKADKAQVLKIAEEYSEVFSAWEDYDRNGYLYSEERAHLVDECADLITATCNLLAAIGVDDMRGAMAECAERNRARGRL